MGRKESILKCCIGYFRETHNDPIFAGDLYARLLDTGKYGSYLTRNRFCSIMGNRIFVMVSRERSGKILRIHPLVFRMNNAQIFALTDERKGDFIDRGFKSNREGCN